MEFVFQKFLFSGVCLVRSLSFRSLSFQEFVFSGVCLSGACLSVCLSGVCHGAVSLPTKVLLIPKSLKKNIHSPLKSDVKYNKLCVVCNCI